MVDVMQFANDCHRKTLLSLCYMWPCIVRMYDQTPFTFFSTPSNDFGENRLDIVGGREHLSFWHGWHGINNLESMGIPDERSHQFRALNHMLLPIGDLISIWQSDHLMTCRQVEP
jgi:hypothetical protein